MGVPYPYKGCEGLDGFYIESGHYGATRLDGLKFASLYHWPGPLHEGNGSLQLFIDERADAAQRAALVAIGTGQAGGPLFEIMASIVTTLHETQFVAIGWEFDQAARRARLTLPGIAETVSAPLKVPATDETQRVIVRMPDGFEYKEMDVALAVELRSNGAIAFEHRNCHSSLAMVEHTPAGLVA